MSIPVPTELPTLASERLLLRHITESDAPALWEIFSDPRVTRFWSSAPLADFEAARALVREIQAYADEGNLMQWGITWAEAPEQVVGTCTLAEIEPWHQRAEIGFAVSPRHWGQGIASEAAERVIRFGFENLRLQRIAADVDPRNLASIRVLERLGFRREGCLREHYWQNNEWQDGLLFGLLQSDQPPLNVVVAERG